MSTSETPVLGMTEMQASQSQPHLIFNAAMRLLEVLTQARVTDKDLTSPPSSPSLNARYIVPAGATGAWDGQAGKIAYFKETAWAFVTPDAGWRAYVADESAYYVFNGSAWVLDSITAESIPRYLGELLDVDTSSATAGQVLTVLAGSPQAFTFQDPSGLGVGGGTLDSLDDVNAPSPTNGDVLTYDAGSPSGWRNQQPVGGGTLASLVAEMLADSPTALYRMDETSGTTFNDSASGSLYDLTSVVGTPVLADGYLIPGDTTKFFRTGTDGGAQLSGTTLGASMPLTGDWTICALVSPLQVNSTNAYLITAIGAAGETEAANYQFFLQLSSARVFELQWERGAGTNEVSSSGFTAEHGSVYHLAAVKDGTANTVTFYVNGRKFSSVSYGANEPTGGTGTLVFSVGRDTNSVACSNCVLGAVGIYLGQKLSDARIRAYARAAGLW